MRNLRKLGIPSRFGFAVLFAGLFGSAFVPTTPAAAVSAFKEKVLYSFSGDADGAQPYANVIKVKSTLYGTTFGGGNSFAGTVFAIDLSTGLETVLYSFDQNRGFPEGGLIDRKGTLYGTASGQDTPGIVFSFDLDTGVGKTLYNFCGLENCSDGANPLASVIKIKNTLYGTTVAGGRTDCHDGGCGTVFALNPDTGVEKVLYSFCSQQNCADGANPLAGLITVNGMLYGTTSARGAHGGGNVFAIDPNTGAATIVYSFCSLKNCGDGRYPLAALVDVNNRLYGTTISGGGNGCGGEGCGTVFSFDLSTGKQTVLYSFCSQKNCTDGRNPMASLVDVNGTLYGTTIQGGSTGCGAQGCGTVFSLDPSTGTEAVLHSFSGSDGESPRGGLVAAGDKFYGTTISGGASGNGTVFMLKPTS
jgi:uncharacterized repeat protein (TIGR03803 family)